MGPSSPRRADPCHDAHNCPGAPRRGLCFQTGQAPATARELSRRLEEQIKSHARFEPTETVVT